MLKEDCRFFAVKYQLYLTTEEALRKELKLEREWFIREREEMYGV